MNKQNAPLTEYPPNETGKPLDRRALFAKAGALAAFGGIAMGSQRAHAQTPSSNALIEAALHCVQQSELCLAHCIRNFKTGDTMLAACSGLVVETAVTCEALAKLGAYNSVLLKDIANLCITACEACQTECNRHASHHEECKACAESCAACIAECKKVV